MQTLKIFTIKNNESKKERHQRETLQIEIYGFNLPKYFFYTLDSLDFG